jgi:murein DD-endopeptidase MepM/ murein hydrolase activator NlpD
LTTSAGVFSFLADFFSGKDSKMEATVIVGNSQTMPLLQSSPSPINSASVGGGDINIVDGNALLSENGPSGTVADINDTVTNGTISRYIVRKGDSLSSIAKMFGVSTNTIVWANDISGKSIKEGQELVILPVSGVIHTVAKGETLSSIAKKYKGDLAEIQQFNSLDSTSKLAIGDTVIIPDGDAGSKVSTAKTSVTGATSLIKGTDNVPSYAGYYMLPISGGRKTQGLHGYNAVDYAIPVGSSLVAAAGGEVVIAKTTGWNGGYAEYIVISHYNGSQTVYGHLSAVYVTPGQRVTKGQLIGLTGNTGNSTGPHLHLEIRGAKNPF